LTDVSSLQVSAGFSESDAAKLVVGQNVTYSFAALPNLVATGKLLSIDLLPTTTSGATSYKATFAITDKVPNLKPGMTATVTVTTGAAMNVLQVASQAVSIRGSGASVNVITTVAGKDVITRTPVVVGLQGDSADQIISGIKPGTKVVLRSVSASVGTNGFPSVGIPSGLGGAGLAGAAGGGGGARGGRNGG
jgi:macrolide-specific efflux system membrane fusion protein